MSDDLPTLSKQFDFMRDVVKHEDTLVNYRTTWTLVFQGFLFAALPSAVGLLEKFKFDNPSNTPVHWCILLVCTLGIFSSIAAYLGIKTAENFLVDITGWWENQRGYPPNPFFPPVYIHRQHLSKINASLLFALLSGVWALFAIIFLFAPALVPYSKP